MNARFIHERTTMMQNELPEPWLRGTSQEIPAIPRAVLHALQLAVEDLCIWCGPLTDDELNARPWDLPSVSFHVRHLARSLDRLLTYAEQRSLNEDQRKALELEFDSDAIKPQLLAELNAAIDNATARILRLPPSEFEQPRFVGRKRLPTTLAGLLIHIADHSQRHVGQAVTTARVVLALRDSQEQ